MKVTERLDVIDKIARELQRRYTYTEIDIYLAAFNIVAPALSTNGFNSKWVYSKAALRGQSLAVIARIADDLGIGSISNLTANANPPSMWKDTKALRLFLSHLSKDKDKATRLRACLKPYGIEAFVAHQDIEPTREWQTEIERSLHVMDAFVAIHTTGFSNSNWTQQEIGFAVARGVKIVSLKMGEDPTGFISKHQALARGNKPAEAIAKELAEILAADERTSARLRDAQAALKAEQDIPF